MNSKRTRPKTLASETTHSLSTKPSAEVPRARKSTAGKRRIQHEWKEAEVKALIAAVEVRPVLWNANSGEYKCSRLAGWREVLDEININNVDISEVKTKWLALRATFKTNLAKLQEKKSEQEALESQMVSWRYFDQMLFLSKNKMHQSSRSTSSIDLVSDHSIFDEFPDSPQTPKIEVAQRCKHQCVQETQTLDIHWPTPQVSSTPTTTVAGLQTSDPNTTFCDNILAELRTLSEVKSRNLRRQLMQTMYNFLDASEEIK